MEEVVQKLVLEESEVGGDPSETFVRIPLFVVETGVGNVGSCRLL